MKANCVHQPWAELIMFGVINKCQTTEHDRFAHGRLFDMKHISNKI